MVKKLDKSLANILPIKMVEIFHKNTPLQAAILKKEFVGLWIEASGTIRMIEDIGVAYVSFLFDNEADGVGIIANFDVPIEKELLVLKSGDKIKVKGKIFDLSNAGVILDHCELIQGEKENSAFIGKNKIVEAKDQSKLTSKTWWKKPEIIISILIATISIPWWPGWIEKINKAINNEKEKTIISETSSPSIRASDDLLRPLEPLETGKKIGELPNNVYFFGSPNGVVYEIEDSNNDFLSVTSKRLNNFSFEMQKIDSRYYLVGFVSDEMYSRIGSVNSENSLYAVIFPNKWGGASHPIAIPFDTVYSAQDRTINLDSNTEIRAIDIGFKEVKDQPEVHGN